MSMETIDSAGGSTSTSTGSASNDSDSNSNGIDYSSIHSSFFSIPMLDPDTGDERMITVSWPSDHQWVRRQRSRTITIRNLGRGATETKVDPDEDVSLSIYNQIKQPGSPDLSPADAEFIIDYLSNCDVLSVDRELGVFAVKMDVPGVAEPVVHSLRCPTMSQIRKYENGKVSSRQGRYGLTKLQLLIEPAGDLYDDLTVDSGFKACPIIHKSAAVEAVISEIKDRVEAKANANTKDSASGGSGFPQ